MPLGATLSWEEQQIWGSVAGNQVRAVLSSWYVDGLPGERAECQRSMLSWWPREASHGAGDAKEGLLKEQGISEHRDRRMQIEVNHWGD